MDPFAHRIGLRIRRWWTGLSRFEFGDHQARIRMRQRLPLAAGLIALAWHLAFPSSQAAVLFSAWLGLMLCAYLWARQMAGRVSGSRRLISSALQVGDELEEQISLRNTSFLPVLAAEFIDHSDLPGHSVSSVRALDSNGHADWKASVLCTRRGLFNLGPWELLLSDPFGIFTVEQTYPQQVEVLVYPQLAPLPPALLPGGRTRGDQRPLRRMLGADTVTAASARAYQPGDALRFIHWPTSARKNALYTRVFDPEAVSSIWLIPDLSPGVHWGASAAADQAVATEDSTLEVMVVLLASLADQLLRARLAVGLLALGSRPHILPPVTGPAAFPRLLRALAQVQADAPQSLAETLSSVEKMISRRSLFVLVTPDAAGAWLPALQNLAASPGGQPGEVLLLDPLSFGGKTPAAPMIELLRQMGFPAEVVRRGDVRPVSGAFGALRRWEYITTATGRAVVRQRPRAVEGSPQ